MTDKAPNPVNQEKLSSSQALTMLEKLADDEMVEQDDNGLRRFRVGDLSVGGVTVTIDSKARQADLIGALKHGEPTRSVQVTNKGTEGNNLGFTDDGDAPEPMGEATSLEWVGEVCSSKTQPDGVAA